MQQGKLNWEAGPIHMNKQQDLSVMLQLCLLLALSPSLSSISVVQSLSFQYPSLPSCQLTFPSHNQFPMVDSIPGNARSAPADLALNFTRVEEEIQQAHSSMTTALDNAVSVGASQAAANLQVLVVVISGSSVTKAVKGEACQEHHSSERTTSYFTRW